MHPSSLLLLALLACGGRAGGAEDAMKAASTPSPLHAEALVFADPRDGLRHGQLRADARARGLAAGPAFELGNFVVERWCSPQIAAADCAAGRMSVEKSWGAAWLDLRAHTGRERPPAVFGLTTRSVDLRGEIGVNAAISLRGRGVSGNGYTIQLLRPGGEVALTLSGRMSWKVADRELSVVLVPGGVEDAAARGVEEAVAGLVHSPERFRERALAHIAALSAEITRALDAHEVYRCELDMRAYQGDGRPPPCVPIPLTPEEEASWRARSAAEMDALAALVRERGDELHARLAAALPPAIWAP